MSLAILILSTSMSPRAKAFESPLEGLLDLGKKITDINQKNKNQIRQDFTRQGNNQKDSKKSVSKQEKAKDRTPQAVTDPKEVEKAVEFASEKTGVRKDFLMGMLTVESNLGRNPGKCTYKEVEDGAQAARDKGQLSTRAWNTFKQRQETMNAIAHDLGYDVEELKVSCNPGNYAGTGGAMGIPQFMPDIWMAYKDRISAIVGKENPDPWDIQDGVVAMALLVSDTPGVTDHNLLAERNAAKMYLSGSTSSAYDWYANQIFYWAANYKTLLVG